MVTPSLRVFNYIADLDCFVVNEQYRNVAEVLSLSEWHPAVWIGRLFSLDNDYGEHWFDNWELREQLQPEAEKRGIPSEELMIIDPERFKNDADGPCHPSEIRKQFWTDVLQSLELSYEVLFAQARLLNTEHQGSFHDMYIEDLEERIERIRRQIGQEAGST